MEGASSVGQTAGLGAPVLLSPPCGLSGLVLRAPEVAWFLRSLHSGSLEGESSLQGPIASCATHLSSVYICGSPAS